MTVWVLRGACAVWEIYHCGQAFEGMMEGQICLGVCEQTLRPEFAEDCPEPYSKLARSCWHQDPVNRCAFMCMALPEP